MKDWRNCMPHGFSLASHRSLSHFLADSCFMFKTYSRVLNREGLCYPCVPKRHCMFFGAAYVQVPFEFDQQQSCLISLFPFEANSWAKGRSTCYVRYTHFAPRRGDILEAASEGENIYILYIYVYPDITPGSFMLSVQHACAQPCSLAFTSFRFPFQEKVLVPSWVNSAFETVHLAIQNVFLEQCTKVNGIGIGNRINRLVQ